LPRKAASEQRLVVAFKAEHSEILDVIVGRISINVVYLNGSTGSPANATSAIGQELGLRSNIWGRINPIWHSRTSKDM
jgi:hypothetical protein